MAILLAVAGDVFDGVLICAVFSHEMSWMGSRTELSVPENFITFSCHGRSGVVLWIKR